MKTLEQEAEERYPKWVRSECIKSQIRVLKELDVDSFHTIDLIQEEIKELEKELEKLENEGTT